MSGKVQSTIRQLGTGAVRSTASRFFVRLELREGHALAEGQLSGEGSIRCNVAAFETG